MPRKYGYEIDHEDYEEDYSCYDDDYYYGDEGDVKTWGSKAQTDLPHVWRCSMCSYDNEESMSACDICGVLRSGVAGKDSIDDTKSVENTTRDIGASNMAKTLFATSLRQRSCMESSLQQRNMNIANRDSNFLQHHTAFDSSNNSRASIAPFKFDVPSPDDVGSVGLRGPHSSAHVVKSQRMPSATVKESRDIHTVSKGTRSNNTPMITEGNKCNKVKSISLSSEGTCIPFANKSDVSILVPEAALHNMHGTEPSESQKTNYKSSKEAYAGGSPPSSKETSHSLCSVMQHLSVSGKSDISKKKPKAHSHHQEERLISETSDALCQLNLAIVGHVDSGKSTISGRLLHTLGRVTQKDMHKFEKASKLQGKGSFAYAWALDESSEERERGITMAVSVAYFDSKRYHVVLLDSPGHKDFVPNMITGATQADCAVLVIDATPGAFEAGMDSKGQTREHARLVRSFGIYQIIIAVNKMDSVGYSSERFNSVKKQLESFLRSCGFKDSCISWVPLSAIENQNLTASPSDTSLLSWFGGPCLLDAIDSLKPPARDFSKPLLMPICDVIKSPSFGQVLACGKLEAGSLRKGAKVSVMPSNTTATVRLLERDSQQCDVARSGENVSVGLDGDPSFLMAGGVLCQPDSPVTVASHLELKVLVLDNAPPVVIGSQFEFHTHHAREVATVIKIVSLLNPKTGEVTKKAPRCLTSKQSAAIEVALDSSLCVQEFSKCKALGRVFLRAQGRTVAVGIITRVLGEQ